MALPQDRREVPTVTGTSASPNGGRGADLAIFLALGRTPPVGCVNRRGVPTPINTTDGRSASQCQKNGQISPSTTVWASGGAGNRRHLASVLRQRHKTRILTPVWESSGESRLNMRRKVGQCLGRAQNQSIDGNSNHPGPEMNVSGR